MHGVRMMRLKVVVFMGGSCEGQAGGEGEVVQVWRAVVCACVVDQWCLRAVREEGVCAACG